MLIKAYKKFGLISLGFVALFLGFVVYRTTEHAEIYRQHGQCEMEARKLYQREEEEADKNSALPDPDNFRVPHYIEACMRAEGYASINNDAICKLLLSEDKKMVLLNPLDSPACYEPDTDYLSRIRFVFKALAEGHFLFAWCGGYYCK